MKIQGTNRTALARELGISSRTMAKIGRGEKLSPIILNKISAYFKCRPTDLYEIYPDREIPVTGGAIREDSGVFRSGNTIYIVDRDYHIVEFNQALAERCPKLKKGDLCYSALMKRQEPCQTCPLKMESDEDLTFFYAATGQWLSIRRAEIDYPGVGKCGMLTCSRSGDMHRNIKNRLPVMTGYDVYIEMNLTKNCYRIILPDDPAQEKDFSRDRLDDLVRRTADNLVHPNDRDAFLEFWDINTLMARLNGPEREVHGMFRECRKSGVWDTVYITIVKEEYYGTSDVIIMALYMIVPGIAAETEEQIEENTRYVGGRKINYDYMTGLPLRRSFWDLIDERPATEEPCGEYCMIATDIEHFHVINNWYGRAAGDALLSEIGAFLKSCEGEGECLSGYMGGDNFCTIFKYQEETLNRITSGVGEIVKNFRNGSGFHPVFGACCVDLAETNAADAYDLCIMALTRGTKGDADEVYWYNTKMVEEQKSEERLLFRFREGMENGEITFYLQPKCDIKTGRIVGAEALARWISPQDGFISPAVFIPVLEKAGKVSVLDYFIWESVCKTIAGWRAAGLPVLPVSVNISRIDVFSMDIVYNFTSLIGRYGLSTSDIELEITESAYVENDTILHGVQEGLRTAGFSTLIDDFGSGYSSLNFLKDIDSDAIKLDLRFLATNESNAEKGESILTSILTMAERLNLVTIAEGVETKEQADFLAYHGCPLAQGFYYYKPMPVEDFEQLLADPRRISEGLHLNDFTPRPAKELDADMKIFGGFDENLASFMKTLLDVAALVRIVDVKSNKEYRLDKGGHLISMDGHCYDIWGRKKACSDCISVIAVETGKVTTKYETIGRDTYYIIAKPILIGGEIHAMETAIKITQAR